MKADVEGLLRAMRRRAPRSPETLWEFIRCYYRLAVPRRRVCPHHVAPFDYVWASYSQQLGDLVVWANRGGAKTELGSVTSHLDSIFRPGCQTRILGGSLQQSERMYAYLTAKWDPHFAELLAGEPRSRRTVLRNRSVIEILTQSQRSVRGQRVQRVKCDEVDEFDAEVWQAVQFVTQSRAGIRASLEAFSTMHHAYGLMSEVVGRATDAATVLYGGKEGYGLRAGGYRKEEEEEGYRLQAAGWRGKEAAEAAAEEEASPGMPGALTAEEAAATAEEEASPGVPGALVAEEAAATAAATAAAAAAEEEEEEGGEEREEETGTETEEEHTLVLQGQSDGTRGRKLGRGIIHGHASVAMPPDMAPLQGDATPWFGHAGRVYQPGRSWLFAWCLWETIERCTGDWSCSRCALSEDCQGRAKEAEGFIRIDDAISQMRRSGRAAWETEMLCQRPRRDRLVFPQFSRRRHVRPVVRRAGAEIYRGLDFGFANPFVCLWAQVVGSDVETSRVEVLAEYVQSQRTIREHVAVLQERPWPVRMTFCDPAGRQRDSVTGLGPCRELARHGILTKSCRSGIIEGVEQIRALLDPAAGPPRLVVDGSCEQLIRALEGYHYGAAGSGSELPEKDGEHDHLIDALRYMITNLFGRRREVRDVQYW